MSQTTLNAEIAAILASPATPAQQALVIEQLVMTALAQAPTGDPSTTIAEAQALNLKALQATRPDVGGPGGVSAEQSDSSQASAATYVVKDYDKSTGNPTKYFFDEFTAAGYTDVNAANGPVERAGAASASVTNGDYKAAVQYVIANYPAGTAGIKNFVGQKPTNDPNSFVVWPKDKVDMVLALFDGTTDPELKYYHLSNVENNALRNRGVNRLDIARGLEIYAAGATPAGFVGTAYEQFRDNTPWTRLVVADASQQVWE